MPLGRIASIAILGMAMRRCVEAMPLSSREEAERPCRARQRHALYRATENGVKRISPQSKSPQRAQFAMGEWSASRPLQCIVALASTTSSDPVRNWQQHPSCYTLLALLALGLGQGAFPGRWAQPTRSGCGHGSFTSPDDLLSLRHT